MEQFNIYFSIGSYRLWNKLFSIVDKLNATISNLEHANMFILIPDSPTILNKNGFYQFFVDRKQFKEDILAEDLEINRYYVIDTSEGLRFAYNCESSEMVLSEYFTRILYQTKEPFLTIEDLLKKIDIAI